MHSAQGNPERTDPEPAVTDETDTLHAIDNRLILVESEVAALASTNRWVRGIAVVLVLQVILAGVGYGRLMEQVDQLHIDGLETNVNTALQVLGDHGTELAEVRSEQHRIRGVLDGIQRIRCNRPAGSGGEDLPLRPGGGAGCAHQA